MIDKDLFKKEIDKLVVEFEDKGFKMTKERAEQWYENFKDYEEIKFAKAIKNVLNTSRFSPSMADISQAYYEELFSMDVM
jgi:hypothetical protein